MLFTSISWADLPAYTFNVLCMMRCTWRNTENFLNVVSFSPEQGTSIPVFLFPGLGLSTFLSCLHSTWFLPPPSLPPSLSLKIWKAQWDFLFSGDYLGLWWCLSQHMLEEPLQVVQVECVKAWVSSLEQLLLQPLQYAPHHLVLSKSADSFLRLIQLPGSLQMRSGNQTWGALYKGILRSIWCFNNLKTFQKLLISKNNLGNLKWFNMLPHWAHYTCTILWKDCVPSEQGVLFYFSLLK